MINVKNRFISGLLLVSLCGAVGWAQSQGAPGAAPTYPDQPPPPIGTRALTGTGFKIPLQTGWNLVSFPYAQVSNVRGLSYALLRPHGTAYSIVDPIGQPRELDTRYGYWAYAAQPGALEVTGSGSATQPVPLEPGWNLVGCPASSNMTITQLNSVDANKPLAFDKTFGGLGGNIQPIPLSSGTVLQPGGTYWVYAYRRGQIQWQPAVLQMPQGAPPAIRAERPLGPPPTSMVAEAVAGQGQLSGKVTDRQGTPVYKARITVTNSGGSYKALTNVPAGPQQITVLTRTCEPLTAAANVVAGANAPVHLVVLHRFGVIACHMYTFDYQGNHFRPVKVEMWETTDPSYHYTNFYSKGWERYRTNAYWKPFQLGEAYSVQITWEDKAGNQLWSTRNGTAVKPLVDLTFYNSWT